MQADGRIVVAGQSSSLMNPDFAVARFHADGSPDTTFGTDGRVTADFFGSSDGATCVAIASDGKILAAGLARDGSSNGLGLVRLLP